MIFKKDGESPLCGPYKKGDRVPKTLPEKTVKAWKKAGIIREELKEDIPIGKPKKKFKEVTGNGRE